MTTEFQQQRVFHVERGHAPTVFAWGNLVLLGGL
jgi:hypothetical protein